MSELPLLTTSILLQPGDLETAARTVWGEARGEPELGQVAVAWVIRNRAEWTPPAWWGDSIKTVCRKPFQFSCWNPRDPNRAHLLGSVDALEGYADIFTIVSGVLTGDTKDPTGGATHYRVRGTPAIWESEVRRRGIEPVSIGKHDFYALGPH